MAVQTGTATNYRDLLNRLRNFVTTDAALTGAGQNWQELHFSEGPPEIFSDKSFSGSLNDITEGVASTKYLRTNTAPRNQGFIAWRFYEPYTLTNVRLQAPDFSGINMNEVPRDFLIEFSDDRAAWSVAFSTANQTAWSQGEVRAFAIPASGAHVYWRYRWTENNGPDAGYTSIGQIEVDVAEQTYVGFNSPAMWAIMEGPGTTGADRVFTDFHLYENQDLDYYNWGSTGSLSWEAGAFTNRSKSVYTPFWDQPMPYWFVVNGRRIIVIANVSTIQSALYSGLILPHSTPAEHPLPLYVAGQDDSVSIHRSSTSHNNRHFYDPGPTAACFYMPDNLWKGVLNYSAGAGGEVRSSGGVQIWPWNAGPSTPDVRKLRDTIDGGSMLYPATLWDDSSRQGEFGDLDGVFFVSGHGISAGDVTDVGGVQYLVVQNIFRTDRYYYAAIALE